MKAAALLRVLLTRPGEFRDRILTIVESLADSLNRPGSMAATDMAAMVRATGEVVGADLGNFFQEEGLQEIEARIQSARTKLLNGAARVHDATTELARMCYALCRAVGPEVVVETGVGNGVTSSYFLQALKVNGKGSLWSLDLPPLGAQSGLLVPDDLRPRWHLLRGRTRRMLPELVSKLTCVDIFLHDSLHTYRNMSFEFGIIWPALRESGVMIADDVTMNRAFEHFAANHPNRFSATSVSPVFGIAVKE